MEGLDLAPRMEDGVPSWTPEQCESWLVGLHETSLMALLEAFVEPRTIASQFDRPPASWSGESGTHVGLWCVLLVQCGLLWTDMGRPPVEQEWRLTGAGSLYLLRHSQDPAVCGQVIDTFAENNQRGDRELDRFRALCAVTSERPC